MWVDCVGREGFLLLARTVRDAAQANKELVLGNSSLTPELATKIKELLADPAIIKVQTEQQDLDLDDNAK